MQGRVCAPNVSGHARKIPGDFHRRRYPPPILSVPHILISRHYPPPIHTGRVMRHSAKKWQSPPLFASAAASACCMNTPWQQLFPFFVLHHADVTLHLVHRGVTRFRINTQLPSKHVCVRKRRSHQILFLRRKGLKRELVLSTPFLTSYHRDVQWYVFTCLARCICLF